MERQNVRVIVASEYPQARDFLKELVEEEGAFLVGQAQDVTRAVTLARNLRPDVAIIDSNLPHSVGLDTVRLSRMGGLDTAQIISETIPSTRVIIITNLNRQVLREYSLSMGSMAGFSREMSGSNTPFTLKELYGEVLTSSILIFVNAEVKQWVALPREVTNTSYKTIFFVGLGTVGALSLIFIVVFGGGVVLALAAAVAMLLILVGKRSASFWRKTKSGVKRD